MPDKQSEEKTVRIIFFKSVIGWFQPAGSAVRAQSRDEDIIKNNNAGVESTQKYKAVP